MSDKPTPRLIDLVLVKLKEEFTQPVTSVYRSATYMAALTEDDKYGEIYDIYVNNFFLGEVRSQNIAMWIPRDDTGFHAEPVIYEASDPMFFTHVVNTTKMILQRHMDIVDEGLRGAQYFKP